MSKSDLDYQKYVLNDFECDDCGNVNDVICGVTLLTKYTKEIECKKCHKSYKIKAKKGKIIDTEKIY